MKELSIEEKAKRYDEAIERANELYDEHERDIALLIFPELRESEDEKIRKALIQIFNVENFENYDIKNEEVIAWLEKQGNKDMGISEATKKELEDNLNKALEKETPESWNKFLEKQGEQKPAKNIVETWKEMRLEVYQQASGNRHEPNYSDDTTKMFSLNDIDEIIEKMSEQKPADNIERKYNPYYNMPFEEAQEYISKRGFDIPWTDCDVFVDFRYVTQTVANILRWADDNPKQKPAKWSEEDENRFNNLIYLVECSKENDATKEGFIKFINKFKSLKERMQFQNTITDEELAQAKKDAYNDALDKIEYHSGEPTFDDGWNAAIWYLKKRNELPQNIWKPSNEQMDAIKDAIDYLGGNTKIVRKYLMSLYEDLKKLK